MELGLVSGILAASASRARRAAHSLAGRQDGRGGRALEGDRRGARDDDLRPRLRLGHRVRVRGDEEPGLAEAARGQGRRGGGSRLALPGIGRRRRRDHGTQFFVSWVGRGRGFFQKCLLSVFLSVSPMNPLMPLISMARFCLEAEHLLVRLSDSVPTRADSTVA